jgi:hypothetical protein
MATSPAEDIRSPRPARAEPGWTLIVPVRSDGFRLWASMSGRHLDVGQSGTGRHEARRARFVSDTRELLEEL